MFKQYSSQRGTQVQGCVIRFTPANMQINRKGPSQLLNKIIHERSKSMVSILLKTGTLSEEIVSETELIRFKECLTIFRRIFHRDIL